MIRSVDQFKNIIDLTIYIVVSCLIVILPIVYVSNDSVLCSEIACGHYMPKIFALRAAGTVVGILILMRFALSAQYVQSAFTKSFSMSYILRTYSLLIILVCLSIVMIMSTILSVSIDSSLWGRVPLSDGTSIYNTFSMIIVFAGVLISVTTPNRINQLFIGIVISGVLVAIIGITQFYLIAGDGISISRLSATLPNPLQAGSYFLFTIGFSIILMQRIFRYLESSTYFVITTLILTVQLLGMGLPQSRGPIVISLIMMTGLVLLYWCFSSYKTAIRVVVPVIIAVTLTFIILTFSSGNITGSNDVLGSETQSVVTTLQGRFSSTAETAASGGLDSRLTIWNDSLDVLFNPAKYELLSQSTPILRLVFGFGPDSFPAMNGISATPHGPESTVNKYLYAHNILVQWVIELGMAGVILNLSMFIIVGIMVYKLIFSRSSSLSIEKLMSVSLLSLLFFHLLDQMVNVSSITDSVYRWMLLALIVQVAYTNSSNIKPFTAYVNGSSVSKIISIAACTVAILLTVILVTLFWFKTINYAIGATYASASQQLFASGEYAEAYETMESAIQLAPRNYSYYHWKAEILEASLGKSSFDLECSLQTTDYNQCIVQKVFNNDSRGAEIRPLELTPSIEAANSALKTVTLGIDNLDQFVHYSNRAQLIAPYDWGLKNWIGMAYMNLGMLQESDHILAASNNITQDLPSSAQALLLRGLLRQQTGLLDEAVDYYSKMIELSQNSDMSAQAYNNRGMIYRESGQYENALNDFSQSLELVGESAEVHNNLGGLYLDNNRMSEALSAFSRAIYVNKSYGPAYFNRSLVFASMGNEAKAFEDAYQAEKFGMIVDDLIIEITNMIETYNELNYGSDK